MSMLSNVYTDVLKDMGLTTEHLESYLEQERKKMESKEEQYND